MESQTISALRPLCRLDEIPQDGAKGVEIGGGVDALDLILLHRGGAVLGYVNSCPHQGTPLETFQDKFLDDSGEFLVCSTHGARFRAQDGFCVSGPCKGKQLEPVKLRIADGMVWLEHNEARPSLQHVGDANAPRT